MSRRFWRARLYAINSFESIISLLFSHQTFAHISWLKPKYRRLFLDEMHSNGRWINIAFRGIIGWIIYMKWMRFYPCFRRHIPLCSTSVFMQPRDYCPSITTFNIPYREDIRDTPDASMFPARVCHTTRRCHSIRSANCQNGTYIKIMKRR